MLTLFRVCTGEDWTDVMYINIYGCKRYGYGRRCPLPSHPRDAPYEASRAGHVFAACYFLIFIIIGALVLLTLFIGVITTAMEEATQDEQDAAQELDEKVAEFHRREGPLRRDRQEVQERLLRARPRRRRHESIGRQIDEGEISEMLQEIDESGDGEIDFAEFLQFMLNIKKLNSGGAEEKRRMKRSKSEAALRSSRLQAKGTARRNQ